MLLLVLYNVRSEPELIDTLPERLDWLWFLIYEFCARLSSINNFKHLGVQDAAKYTIS